MIVCPNKKIIGLIGVPRVGKNAVAKYLQKSRNFEAFAFADKIKEEFGISKKDFEIAKSSKNIENLRQGLWDFSAKKRQNDPFYFINLVINSALKSKSSVVITDIRTPEEFDAINKIGRIYWVTKNTIFDKLDKGDNEMIIGSKLDFDAMSNRYLHGIPNVIGMIKNHFNNLYDFYKYLDKFFFMEDIMDLTGPVGSSDFDEHKILFNQRDLVSNYIDQFDISIKR